MGVSRGVKVESCTPSIIILTHPFPIHEVKKSTLAIPAELVDIMKFHYGVNFNS